MDMQERIKLTRSIWIALMVGIVASTLFTAPLIGAWTLGLVFLLVVAAIVVTGFIWQWGVPFVAGQGMMAASQEESEKVKRDRIEVVLRRLSDTQLQNLRERIATGQLSDDDLGDMLEDQNEFKRKR